MTVKVIEKIKECFAYHDRPVATDGKAGNWATDQGATGQIPVGLLGVMMRQLGVSPTESELEDLIAEIGKATFDFPTFCIFLARKSRNQDSSELITTQFEHFDPEGSGKVTVSELKHIMMNIGDKLTSAEFDGMIKAFESKGSPIGKMLKAGREINYAGFIKALIES